jgi:hypothetical protein
MKKVLMAMVIITATVGCVPLFQHIAKDCRVTGCDQGQSCGEDGDGTVWKCYVPTPPTTLPAPSPSPSPTAAPVPSPSPAPLPSPTPAPCVQATPVPCVKPEGCSSCAQYIAWALQGGHLTRLPNGLLYNDPGGNAALREYVDPKTCFMVWPDGSLRNKRYHLDGTICPACPAQPSPSPCPSPSASPVPSPPPSDEDACKLGPDGNYPVPPVGTCPACWKADPNLIDYWGIAFRSKTPCSGPNCPYGIKINVDITPHSRKPYLRHRQQNGGGGTDTWEGCQPCSDPSNPECRAAVPEIWVYPRGAEAGLCDPFSGSLYWCHHKPQDGQGGPTKFEVHAPPFRSIVVDVP